VDGNLGASPNSGGNAPHAPRRNTTDGEVTSLQSKVTILSSCCTLRS